MRVDVLLKLATTKKKGQMYVGRSLENMDDVHHKIS